MIDNCRTDEVYGYAFQCGGRGVLIIWAPKEDRDPAIWSAEIPADVQVFNVAGGSLKQKQIELGESPVYLVSEELLAQDMGKQVQLQLFP